MNSWVAFTTIVRKEWVRIMRIWPQTLLPAAISMTLYFIVFGSLIGSRVGTMGGVPYMDYIVPGVVIMSVITNAYGNVSSSFFSAKFQRHVEELLVAPVPNAVILLGYVSGGVIRGVTVGGIVSLVACAFGAWNMHSALALFWVVLLSAVMFSLAGFINAVFAKKFDDISIIPTFVLTPLTYLGGVFYSIELLPELWRTLSLANPVLYLVNAFRYGMLGQADVSIVAASVMAVSVIVALTGYALWLLKHGTGLRN